MCVCGGGGGAVATYKTEKRPATCLFGNGYTHRGTRVDTVLVPKL